MLQVLSENLFPFKNFSRLQNLRKIPVLSVAKLKLSTYPAGHTVTQQQQQQQHWVSYTVHLQHYTQTPSLSSESQPQQLL